MKLILAFGFSVAYAQAPKYTFGIVADGVSLLTNNERNLFMGSDS